MPYARTHAGRDGTWKDSQMAHANTTTSVLLKPRERKGYVRTECGWRPESKLSRVDLELRQGMEFQSSHHFKLKVVTRDRFVVMETRCVSLK